MLIKDMARTDVHISTSVGTQMASASTVDHFASMKARPKTMRN